MFKVYLLGADRAGWALDTELSFAHQAIQPFVKCTKYPFAANLIHSVCPEQLIESPYQRFLQSEIPVIAQFSNDPKALFERVPGLLKHAQHWFCVAQGSLALEQLKSFGLPHVFLVPYPADLQQFVQLNWNGSHKQELRQKLKIPETVYLIGSFQRDSNGFDLNSYKPQKGADIFVEIVSGLQKRVGARQIHVLLAGPRRHWIRNELTKRNIPFSFVGKPATDTPATDDDFPQNILKASQINELMNLCNVYLVSSRWEGAPRAILEAASSHTKIMSTDVGIARDVLEPLAIYQNISQAIDVLEQDMKNNILKTTLEKHYEKVITNHTVEVASQHWQQVYETIGKTLKAHKRSFYHVLGSIVLSEKICFLANHIGLMSKENATDRSNF